MNKSLSLLLIANELSLDISKNEIFQKIFNIKERNMTIALQDLCILFSVSRSGYYKWLKEKKVHHKYNKHWLKIIEEIFYENHKIYGRAKIRQAIINKYGISMNEKTVYRYMQHLGLKSKPYSTKRKVESKNTSFSTDDLIKQEWRASKFGEKWFTDVTEIKATDGNVKISAIIDGFNNQIVDFQWDVNKQKDAIYANIVQALEKYKVKPIIHSDHGSEYSSKKYKEYMEKYGFKISMGRVGKSTDNYPIENFWRRLKSEWINDKLPYSSKRTVKEVVNEVTKYVKFYNEKRINMKDLGGLTPMSYYKKYKTS